MSDTEVLDLSKVVHTHRVSIVKAECRPGASEVNKGNGSALPLCRSRHREERYRHLQVPTADWALRKLRDFEAAKRGDITVTDPDGIALTEADLIGIVDGSRTTPPEEGPIHEVTHGRRPETSLA